ncbi:hypothetical protein R1T40_08460 [Tritonibacter scottomollicae]|uniref:Uncharacterized protein n=1 Tax=Tritonibacter scottomollicae TaxID=483013 RepID=A0ABZ0HMH8_TRISK|nr:hypothetical protein [Tritonibacter scottomollicae]WOI34742.1 hypothetical protein R1T40_08460 [Tritonibacter scottomollicae]
MTMHTRPTPLPYETGTTAGGGLLAALGSFFRRFRKGTAGGTVQPMRPQSLFPDQQWLVTHMRPNGDVATEAVLINGGNLQADIDTLARLALRHQRGTDCATIIRISIDYRATPARIELLDRITRDYNARRRFEAECG